MSPVNTTEPFLPPPGLHLEALSEWRRIVKLLRDRELLDGLDQIALRDFVTCWVRLEAAETDISKRGILLTSARGTIKNPSLQIAEQYREFLLAWARELGFTPSSRKKLALAGARSNKRSRPEASDAPQRTEES
jgi:P27 family predicted phage terminase small subunit